jgi:hypothetical protein
MPRVFRVMKRDADGLPTVSQTSLGVRPGKDVDLDAQNNVLVNGKGMSVAPNWREINIHRIPQAVESVTPWGRWQQQLVLLPYRRGSVSARRLRKRTHLGT